MQIKFEEFTKDYLDEVCSYGEFYKEYERINWERDIVDYFIEDDCSEKFDIKEIEKNRDNLENIALDLIEEYKSIVDEEVEDYKEIIRDYKELQSK